MDGFRTDVVNLIGKGTDLDDLPDPPARLPLLADRPPVRSRAAAPDPDAARRLPAATDDGGRGVPAAAGESASYLGDPAMLASCTCRSTSGPSTPTGRRKRCDAVIAASQAEFAEPAWPTWVLSNHDATPSHAVRHRGRARAAAVLSLTIRGTPFLYAGEELGLEDGIVPPERVVDPDGRDGCRAPIPVDLRRRRRRGHGWPTRPWLPFPANASTHAADVEVGVESSMHTLYGRLLALRAGSAALRSGSIHVAPLAGSGAAVRTGDATGERVVVLVNFADRDARGPPTCRAPTSWCRATPPATPSPTASAPTKRSCSHP